MAKIILERIGSPVESFMEPLEFKTNRDHMETLNQRYTDGRAEVRAGWGQKYVDRVHKKGKLTTWERIELLKDPGSKVYPIGTFVNFGLEFGEGGNTRKAPGAGVITAFVKIQNRHVVVIANDNTVASGSWWPLTPEKIERAQEIALKLRIPVVYLIDCSGLFLPEQSKTFPGKTGAGYIFKMNALLSAQQVPQVAGVFGDCIAGGGYMPIISDIVYMTEQAYMVIAGAALVKGGKSQQITSLSIGGPDIHVNISNCADHRVPDDHTLLHNIRKEIAKLPSTGIEYYYYGQEPAPPLYDPTEIEGLFPVDYRVTYDIKQVIARLTDHSLFWELLPDKGREIVCGVGKINGLYVGIIANNQHLTRHPTEAGIRRPGGILYRDGIAKITTFARACDSDGIPIVWLQDIAGFDIGLEAEKMGLLGWGSNLLYANSTNKVPVITVLLRKASGAGYYAMNGRPYEPIVQLSTPLTRLAVMEGRTLAIGAFRTKLDDNFNIVCSSDEEYQQVKKGMEEVERRITEEMDPIRSSRQLDTDEIVLLSELRPYLETMVEMTYQSIGYRRVKNPRIWSMHDIAALSRHSGGTGDAEETEETGETGPGTAAALDFEVPEGAHVVTAFSTGIFYARPAPDEPPYVTEGDVVEKGKALGLIEVMKTFNQIIFHGINGSDSGRITKILVSDAQEVKEGQPLFLVEESAPAGAKEE